MKRNVKDNYGDRNKYYKDMVVEIMEMLYWNNF